MGPAAVDAALQARRAPSAAQARIITAALDLFALHGVGGTSLQMIADRIGVTKAAVYHQFRTKDEIVVAAAGSELARLEAALDVAEAQPSRAEARDLMVSLMVDLAVERRRTVSTILRDPVIARHFATDERFRSVMSRLNRVLLDGDGGPESRVRLAMFIAATSGSVIHPAVVDLDDDLLRTQLHHLARSLLNLPP